MSALNANGLATLVTSTQPLGSDKLTASYGATANFNASTSFAYIEVVNKRPQPLQQTVTFTATVNSSLGGTPTGTVTFFDGTMKLGSGKLNSSAQAAFSTSKLGRGSTI